MHYVVNKDFLKNNQPTPDKEIFWKFVDDQGKDLIPASQYTSAELVSPEEQTIHYKETQIDSTRELLSIYVPLLAPKEDEK